jgi:hypothetical protein
MKGVNRMSNDDWEDLREEVCTHLELSRNMGETELDTMARLLWLERQKHVSLCLALETILKASTAALERERGLAAEKAVVLKWRKSKAKLKNVHAASMESAVTSLEDTTGTER